MVFERKHAQEPTDAAGFLDRGNRYSRNGVYHKAIEDYGSAIELEPELAEAFYHRGCSWYEVGKNEDAIADLTEAIELDPMADAYYGQRAIVYIFQDEPELAQADEDICQELRIRAQENKSAR
ncbi:MAG: hypothetical protein CL902_12165 [Dehalococcoidia bacterium]|nr:hypothetical protein [Dehalococcoidia bacterium]